jgi:DNA repair protein RecN (Recombination protein N)
MLASLTVRDIVLIERAELPFSPGLNVLTGETGAGKSILLDALGLAAGERGGGRAAIRPGAGQAVAIATFELPVGHPVQGIMSANGIATDGGELILRRMLSPDGRTRAFANDQPVGIQLAREIGALLVEIHGQSDDRGLFDSGTHRELLDAFGRHGQLADEVGELFAAVSSATTRRDGLRAAQAAAETEAEYYKFAASELRDLAPQPGEEAELASARALMMNAGRLAQEIGAALESVAGDGGAEVKLGNALRRLSRLSEEGRKATHEAEEALDKALVLVQAGRSELERLVARLNADPRKLEQIEERLFALRSAARKYNTTPEALPHIAEAFEKKLAEMASGETTLAEVEAELSGKLARYQTAAASLSSSRISAAKRLELTVANEFAPLKLGDAQFRVSITAVTEPAATGLERVAFEIATVQGAGFGPLARIASGGELARFALALKVALAEESPPAVLVFDEVDRGVGGAVAAAVGDRLQRLAQNTQVLLVTHSPQVAARGARHFRIMREGSATRVEQLSPEERIEEIARMLAGARVTDEARAAARRLMAEASAEPVRKKRVRA